MRKSASKTTEFVQPSGKTRSKNVALGHPTIGNPPSSPEWPPSPWPLRPEDVTPLAWWRTMPADHLGEAEHLSLKQIISKIGVLKGCEWVSAMHGDAAASIAIALEANPIREFTLEVDLAMTALMLGALGGNATAALVLWQVLRRAPLDHPFAKELSVSWLVLNLRDAKAGLKQTVRKRSRTNKAAACDAGPSALEAGASA